MQPRQPPAETDKDPGTGGAGRVPRLQEPPGHSCVGKNRQEPKHTAGGKGAAVGRDGGGGKEASPHPRRRLSLQPASTWQEGCALELSSGNRG